MDHIDQQIIIFEIHQIASGQDKMTDDDIHENDN